MWAGLHQTVNTQEEEAVWTAALRVSPEVPANNAPYTYISH